jgi:hypothetical protein
MLAEENGVLNEEKAQKSLFGKHFHHKAEHLLLIRLGFLL